MSKLHDADIEHLEKLTSMARAKSFLGREFLTWLWRKAETDGDEIQLRSGPEEPLRNARLWVDDRVVLEDLAGVGHVYTMKGGSPSQSPEAAAALAAGKIVMELKLGLEVDGVGTFLASLRGDQLAPRTLQLPAVDEHEELLQEDILDRRLALMDEFVGMMDHLFSMYMGERVDKSWSSAGLQHIKDWIKDRGEILQNLVH